MGRCVGGAVKVLDSQPLDHEFESRCHLSFWYLESMYKTPTCTLRFSGSLSHNREPGSTEEAIVQHLPMTLCIRGYAPQGVDHTVD